MKLFVLIFTLISTLPTHAGLITSQSDQSSYNTGDLITIDLFINHATTDIAWLELKYDFDVTELGYELNSFALTPEAFNQSWFALDDVDDVFGSVFLWIGLFDGWDQALTNSFQLGQIQFTALNDISNFSLSLPDIYAEDPWGGVIDETSLQVEVPEPSTIALLIAATAGLLARRRQQR
ncbi:PEP-CTERM sorting domain-containing protein [Echinimonas agarilytica]|uniref:PEP-CTERM sorting domain-containing protein n=1 Tax=Echinimonas agarilytica TaxID=1215918 RepID=A0AA41W9M6_9GAMM|nr:PEP-CTERM sorting domain-containing protein [Echinimonas agarilytica]MCM2680699.1 PEP-CTERM sorting domain-containing protein [Echinimonas agarilytica]